MKASIHVRFSNLSEFSISIFFYVFNIETIFKIQFLFLRRCGVFTFKLLHIKMVFTKVTYQNTINDDNNVIWNV